MGLEARARWLIVIFKGKSGKQEAMILLILVRREAYLTMRSAREF